MRDHMTARVKSEFNVHAHADDTVAQRFTWTSGGIAEATLTADQMEFHIPATGLITRFRGSIQTGGSGDTTFVLTTATDTFPTGTITAKDSGWVYVAKSTVSGYFTEDTLFFLTLTFGTGNDPPFSLIIEYIESGQGG